MGEKFRITVRASSGHSDLLTIQDAMQQVLDIFSLLEKNDGESGMVWRLSVATTNSPFHVEGEAVSRFSGVDVSVMARAEKAEFSQGMRELVRGIPPSAWVGTPKADIAVRILRRNQNGIGETDIDFDDKSQPITIVPQISEIAVSALSLPQRPSFVLGAGPRKERGSLEGEIRHVGTYYNKPAIKLKERKSKQEIWCEVSKDVERQIAKQADFVDVWERSRVIIKGTLEYASDGKLVYVFADNIERIVPHKVSVSDLRDRNFTGGLEITDYLNKFREGELG